MKFVQVIAYGLVGGVLVATGLHIPGCAKAAEGTIQIPDSGTADGGTGNSPATTGGKENEASTGTGGDAVDGAAVCAASGKDFCGYCTDLKSDKNNCSECGIECLPSEVCSEGTCSCPNEGDVVCAGACVNNKTNVKHCGACDVQCVGTQVCNEGTCECQAGQTLCSGTCVDLQKSSVNCGRCDNVCAPGKTCENGGCSCDVDAGLTICDGDCVDLQSDAKHCGTCEEACQEEWVCGLGECMEGCPAEAPLLCGAACVDPQTATLNCGECDKACQTDWICEAGTCVCGSGLSFCDEACVDAQTSNEHCGECGNACGTGQLCTAGVCVCTEGLEACGDKCVDLLADKNYCGNCETYCGEEQSCTDGACTCSETTQTACGLDCADTSTSRSHCGACDAKCESGEVCQASKCVQSDLRVESNCQVESSAIRPQLRLCNTSSKSISIAGMTLVYWFDQDDAAGTLTAEIDYGPSVATTTILTIQGGPAGADRSANVTFSGSLGAGDCAEAQLRIHTSTYTQGFDGTNDYSYKEGNGVANELVGLYDAEGSLIWGIEPTAEPATPAGTGGATGTAGAAAE